jgi:2'-5' RNA ligase
MAHQDSLDGFEPPSAPTDRIFFAFMPDEAAADRAEAMAVELGAQHGVKPRKDAREKFHVTLFHVGDFVGMPEQALAQARLVADGLRADPVEIRLDRLASFAGSPRHQPYVLMSTEDAVLTAFQATMQARMLRAGLLQGQHQRRFTPHLTLLYGHHPLPEQAVAEPITWTAREFTLIRSLIGQGRYERLGQWALSGAG